MGHSILLKYSKSDLSGRIQSLIVSNLVASNNVHKLFINVCPQGSIWVPLKTQMLFIKKKQIMTALDYDSLSCFWSKIYTPVAPLHYSIIIPNNKLFQSVSDLVNGLSVDYLLKVMDRIVEKMKNDIKLMIDVSQGCQWRNKESLQAFIFEQPRNLLSLVGEIAPAVAIQSPGILSPFKIHNLRQ